MSISTDAPPVSRTPWSSWLLAIRPKTLPAAVSPVIVGCAVAWSLGAFAWLPALAAVSVALLLQMGANLANDVADFRAGADTVERLGPTRVTQSGLLSQRKVVVATAVVLGAATIPGLYLVWLGGPLFLIVGLLAILSAVAYTAGPKPFGYIGLGEVFVSVFFGPVAVVGTVFVMARETPGLAWLASIPMGCLITAILVVNNLRDIRTDKKAGKKTVAVRIGEIGARWEYALLLAVAYVVPLGMWIAGASPASILLPWATIPLAIVLIRNVWTVSGAALNTVLGSAARLCLWFAVALAVGIML